jgi:quinol monooxygenase YgiN
MTRSLCVLALIAACSSKPSPPTTPTAPPVWQSGEMVGLLARVKILPGKEEALLAALRETAAKVQETEPDTLVYMFFRSKTDPNELVIFEIYKSKDAMDAHNKSATLAALRPKLPELIDMTTFKIEHTDPAVLGFMR